MPEDTSKISGVVSPIAAILVDHVQCTLGGKEILHNVSFQVNQGDIFGFIGPNGAGKTTTIRTVLGLYRTTGGTVSILGDPAGSAAARAKTGVVFDQDGLFDDLTAAANIAYYLELYNRPPDPTIVTRVLNHVGLADRANDKVRTFSRGMRQKVAIARAVAHDPQVLIMDEPTSGVDPVSQIQIHDLITQLVQDHGKTVMISSHNLDEVQRLCNRIALIGQGKILLQGTMSEISATTGPETISATTQKPFDEGAAETLSSIDGLTIETIQGSQLCFTLDPNTTVSEAVAALAARGVELTSFTSNSARLEQVFAAAVKSADSPA